MNDATLDDGTPHDTELRAIAARLGARAAERVDVERTAQAVLERLRAPAVLPLARRVRAAPVWMRIAAGLALLAGAAVVGRTLLPSSQSVAHFVHEDLADLSVEQLNEVLQTLDATLDESVADRTGGLEQLTEQQLEALLRALEGEMRRTLYLAAVLLAVAPPLAAQDEQAPPLADSARRERLEQEIERRFAERVRRDLGLSDEQATKLRATHEKFSPRRREVMVRQRELRMALADQMRPGVAADPDSVRKLNDAIAENRARFFELEQEQEREMGGYLSPVQVAQYRMMRERLRERIDDVRRKWGRDRPGRGERPRMQGGRPKPRPR